MKKALLNVISLIFCLSVTAQAVATNPRINVNLIRNYIVDGDDFVPIPWGKELPISWRSLPGTWVLKVGKQQQEASYFTFQMLNKQDVNKMLYIQQIDAKTCKVLGAGVASQADSKVIYATLRSAVNNQVYRVNFRNYNANSFNSKDLPTFEGHVMMMSIAPINSYEFNHYPLARVTFSAQTNINCKERLVR